MKRDLSLHALSVRTRAVFRRAMEDASREGVLPAEMFERFRMELKAFDFVERSRARPRPCPTCGHSREAAA